MKIFAAFAALLALAGPPAVARHFTWTAQSDAVSMDPHGQADVFNESINAFVYETLVGRGKDHSLVPLLAVSWVSPEPTRWVVELRRNVRFHDGTPFTAGDVLYSIQRARETPYRWYAHQLGEPRRVDDHTLEFVTARPNPMLPDMLGVIAIVSRAWCQKHDCRGPREGHVGRHAMGTGPFKLVGWEPGVSMKHVRNTDWWGLAAGLFEGNVESVEFRPLASPVNRLAALVSGQVDFVLDPPVQDVARLERTPGIKVWSGEEMRVTNIVLDQARDELLYSDVKGTNPFKDRRVRLALYQALDAAALRDQVMRGSSTVTAVALHGTRKLGIADGPELRHPYDPAAARELLARAGYPSGFAFTLHCPNDRWINDEKLCTAIAAMWSRVGLRVSVDAMPKARFFTKAGKREISAALSAWGTYSEDAIFILKPVMHTPAADGSGGANFGGVSNRELDNLIARLEVEGDRAARRRLVERAVRIVHDEVLLIPLHRQVIPWASKGNVSVVHTPHNWLVPIWVKVN